MSNEKPPKDTPKTFLQQRKDLERKQFLEKIAITFLMILLVAGVLLLGLEFTNDQIEKDSWIRSVSGLGVCWFSIYGIKIILKIK